MRLRGQALLIPLALLVVALTFPGIAQTPAASGYIFGIHGHWSATNPSVPDLQLGQAVNTGQLLQLAAKADHCFLQIGYVDNSTTLLDCGKDPKSCSGYKVKALAAGSTTMQRISAAWSHLFNQGPVPVVFALSRGGETKGPQEAVLRLDSEKLDPSPALHELVAGKYMLAFRVVKQDDRAPVRVTCQWNPPEAQCRSASGLTPGFYALTVSDDNGPAGSPVAVLVASPGHFETLTKAFDTWKAATQSWPAETRPETIHYFRTAALDALNQTSPDR